MKKDKKNYLGDLNVKEEEIVLKPISKYIIEIRFDKIFDKPDLREINNFILNQKRTYANHIKIYCNYINYFIAHYDYDNELLLAYLKIKFMIDNAKNKYTRKTLIEECYTHLLSDTMVKKIEQMTEDLYSINLDTKSVINNESLQFTNRHGKILMSMSMAMKIFIPLITHYAHVYGIKNMDKHILKCFDDIASYFEGDNDIYSKIYETVTSRINPTKESQKGHWGRVEIEGDDPLNQIDKIVEKIYINIIHKYKFDGNMIFLNHSSIKQMIMHIRKTKSKLNYAPISNTKDTDGLSDFDKIEMNNSKFDESLIILGRINVEQTISMLYKTYNIKSNPKELDYYRTHLKVKPFQKELIFQIFAKYFGNIQDLYNMTNSDYCRLIIIMKRMLFSKGYLFMQHILSGIVEATTARKISTKQSKKVEKSPRNSELEEKYKDVMEILDAGKVLNNYLNVMLNSRIKLVDYSLKKYTNQYINIAQHQDIICDEFLRLVNLI